MPALPKVSVIIVSFNTRELLRACLRRLIDTTQDLAIEVIVVDNASHDQSADMVAVDFHAVHLIRSTQNLGFAAANNLGFQHANGEYILLLNPDALVEAGTLSRALQYMQENPHVGMGGGQLVDQHGRQQPSGRLFPSLLNEALVLSGLAAKFPNSRFFGRFDRTWDKSDRAVNVDWIPGAFAMIRKSALNQVGGFDERFFLYYEEVDLCRRLRHAGWHIQYWPNVLIQHTGGESSKTLTKHDFSSSGSQLTLWRMRSELLYYRKHHGILTTLLVAGLEKGWHLLRATRASLDRKTQKATESQRIVSLMASAWRDTRGGRQSPARPW